MGVEDNKYQIPNLDSNTSFFDWYTKENDEIISKLNKTYDNYSRWKGFGISYNKVSRSFEIETIMVEEE